jgi:hypothetical protein
LQFEGNKVGLCFETAESQFNSVRLIEFVVYSELYRTLRVIVTRNVNILLRTPTMCPAALVPINRGPAASLSAPSRYKKSVLNSRKQCESEYHIQNGGYPGAGIQHIFDP